MRVTIHQPDFLPWLGFFDRWRKCDLYIVLDDVQFIRRGWQHRDKIKTKDGARWLTVPVIKKGKYFQKISDVKIDNSLDWVAKHLKTIEINYGKAPNFERWYGKIQQVYRRKYSYLIDLNMDLLRLVAEEFRLSSPVVFSSRYGIKSTSSQRLVDLSRAVGADEYFTGLGSRKYLDTGLFERFGIRVVWQDFECPAYSQLHGEFIGKLSVLDFLMMAQYKGADGKLIF